VLSIGDKGQSGTKNDRPALIAMLNDLRRQKIDVVVVWALDRLARSLKQLLSIAEECRAVGVDLVSLKQNVDTTLPAGRLTFQVLGAVAEFVALGIFESEDRLGPGTAEWLSDWHIDWKPRSLKVTIPSCGPSLENFSPSPLSSVSLQLVGVKEILTPSVDDLHKAFKTHMTQRVKIGKLQKSTEERYKVSIREFGLILDRAENSAPTEH
jgi:hypothetical protein